jgi:hypothetical protein
VHICDKYDLSDLWMCDLSVPDDMNVRPLIVRSVFVIFRSINAVSGCHVRSRLLGSRSLFRLLGNGKYYHMSFAIHLHEPRLKPLSRGQNMYSGPNGTHF